MQSSEQLLDSECLVTIPLALAERITKRLAKSDFDCIDDYVSFVLEGMLDKMDSMGVSLFKEDLIRRRNDYSTKELQDIQEEMFPFSLYP